MGLKIAWTDDPRMETVRGLFAQHRSEEAYALLREIRRKAPVTGGRRCRTTNRRAKEKVEC